MPYESHVTTSPVFASPARITYPFADLGDTASKIVHQPLLQLSDRYAPPTLSTAFVGATDANLSGSPVTIGSAYCIGDTEPQPAEAGLISFTRMWANIPATNTEYPGSMAYSFPNLPLRTAGVNGTVTSITSISGSTGVYAVTAHGRTVGDIFRAMIFNTDKSFQIVNGFITATTTNTFTGSYTNYGTLSYAKVAFGNNFGKEPKTRNVPSYQINEYFLPGVTAGYATVESIKPFANFEVLDSFANIAIGGMKLTVGETFPSAEEYNAMVAGGVGLVASSKVDRWQGQIYVRKTIYVRAL